MRRSGLLSIALLSTALVAQTSNTLPSGWDSLEGVDAYGTSPANSYFWSNFDLGTSSPATYNPAKTLYLYDSTLFPWNPMTGTTINKISFRRDGVLTNAGTAHSKECVVIMSTSSNHPAQANFNLYDGNHGSNRTVVFGKIGTPKSVTFPANKKPTSGTAPFDVSITLDKPFKVPGGAKTFCVEIRTYKVTGAAKGGWWRCDSVRWDGKGYSGGSFALINTDHCVTNPSIFYTSRAFTTGSNFGHIWRPSQSPGGKLVFTLLGDKLTTPIAFPGALTKCKLYLDPSSPWAIRTDVSETSGAYAVYIDWGTVPNNAAWVGLKLNHQSLFVDSKYPDSVGMTRAGTSTLGSGYDPKLVKASAIYSYGASTARYTAAADPDKEPHGRFFYRRAAIIKIN
jgi:hypothetical protein